jgi:hypothetical protein
MAANTNNTMYALIGFGQAASEEKLFQKLTNKKQDLPVAAIFVN